MALGAEKPNHNLDPNSNGVDKPAVPFSAGIGAYKFRPVGSMPPHSFLLDTMSPAGYAVTTFIIPLPTGSLNVAASGRLQQSIV